MQSTDQPEPEPTHASSTATGHSIIDQPATVEDCAADYKSGAQLRRGFDRVAHAQYGDH